MKVYISPYQLELQRQKQRLQGTLLLFEFKPGLKGYSDFLPWPQFGEDILKDQLKNAKEGKESRRWICSKNIAFCDALARKERRSLFFGLKIPESHFLVEDISSFSQWSCIEKAGFKTIKIKAKGFDFQKELQHIKKIHEAYPHFKWRLDFNGSLNLKEWNVLKESLKFLWNNIEFIEDPFKTPEGFSKKEPSMFAEDWIENSQFPFRIVKPSRDSLNSLDKTNPLSPMERHCVHSQSGNPLGSSHRSLPGRKVL